MLGGPGEAIELGDEKGVAFADEVDSRFELRAFADSRYLLAEDLFASRRLEVAELGLEAGLLFDPRCPARNRPSIPISCLVETKHIMRHPSQNVNSKVYETGLSFGKIAPLGQAHVRPKPVLGQRRWAVVIPPPPYRGHWRHRNSPALPH